MNTLNLILENLVNLIIFIIGVIVIIYFCYCWRHNRNIKGKYKREILEKDKKFKIMRCKEESKNRIYIIDKKEKTYHHIVDPYTLNELGSSFEDAPKEDKKCFSKKQYKIGDRIKIYNLMVDIKQKIDLANEFKKLIKEG